MKKTYQSPASVRLGGGGNACIGIGAGAIWLIGIGVVWIW